MEDKLYREWKSYEDLKDKLYRKWTSNEELEDQLDTKWKSNEEEGRGHTSGASLAAAASSGEGTC